MASQYFGTLFSALAASACLVSNTPPTFAGIVSAVANSDGSVTVSWSAASGGSANPLRYRVHVLSGSVTGATLFGSTSFLVSGSGSTSIKVFTDATGAALVAGQTYTFGVRAVDAVGNVESNLVVATATVSYNLYQLVQAVQTLTTGVKAKTDNLPASPAAVSDVTTVGTAVAGVQTTATAIKAKTDNLPAAPAAVSDVAAVGTAVAGVQSTASAVKAKTDTLPATPAAQSDVTTVGTAVAAVKAKTDQLTFAVDGVNAHTTNIPATDTAAIAAAVWNEPTAAHTTAGTFGENAQTPAIDAQQVADAVWDAQTADHQEAGTFGQNAQAPAIDADQVAHAVWDAQLSEFQQAGSTGVALQGAQTAGAGQGALQGTVQVDEPLVGVVQSEETLIGEVVP